VRQKIVVPLARAKAKGTAANNANDKAISAAAAHHNASNKIVENDQRQAVTVIPNAVAVVPVPLTNALDNNSVRAPLAVNVRANSFGIGLAQPSRVDPCQPLLEQTPTFATFLPITP
jgi:hypothetical protein